MSEKIKPIYESGNSGAITRKMNATCSDYEGEAKKWYSDEEGDVLVAVAIDFTQEVTDHPSGNNPSHVTTHSEPEGTGTVTFFGVDDEGRSDLWPVVKSKYGVAFAPDDDGFWFGFSFDVNMSDGSKTKILIPRMQATGIPKISSTTDTSAGKQIQQMEVPVRVLALYKDGARLPIYNRINSVKHAEGYAEFKDSIVLPVEPTTGA